jgi:hypothetical protein
MLTEILTKIMVIYQRIFLMTKYDTNLSQVPIGTLCNLCM